MKKVMLVLLFALLAVGFATAQFNYIPTTDTLGGHNNGGRGCAGCHAPHSGGRGSGGNLVAGSGINSYGGNEGDQALWGTDVTLITQVNINSGDGGKFLVNFGGAQQYNSSSSALISGIALCLSCHDGQVSKGAMMMNASYEQQASLLPNGAGQGTYHGQLYGTTAIPTLLGSDGSAPGDYSNDHPIGPMANIGAVGSAALNNGLSYSVNGTKVTWTATGQYAQFVANYGDPTVKAMVVDSVNTVPYVVCTTCHNQHIMNVYRISSSTPIGSQTSGTVPTYFFVKGPYNPGAAWTPTQAPSTTQFCRQCHYSHANENYGVVAVTTAF
ncbi:MAG: hypothetical protein ACRD3Q_02475 [Terriglobales bacterium]